MKLATFVVAAFATLAATLPTIDKEPNQNNADCATDAPDIVDVANKAGLTSLVSALTSAGLVDTVQGLSDVTVFAPTNDAFAALCDISALSPDQLGNVLKYHIAQGIATSDSLWDGEVISTLQGGVATITVVGDDISINNANVVVADVAVKQGIVHVIDKVLIPT